MRASHVNGTGAVLLSLALLLPSASALAQVVNQNFTITDATEADTTGTSNNSGTTYGGSGRTVCRNGNNTVTVTGTMTHPEAVKLTLYKAQQMQRSWGNYPPITVAGAGAQSFSTPLVCEKAQMRTAVDAAPLTRTGRFLVEGRNCTGLTETRLNYFIDTCTADVNNQTIQFQVDGTTIQSLKVLGKGGV